MDDDDDYWNTSETKAKAFNFDDDVLSTQEILAIGQKSYSPSGPSEESLFNNISITTVQSAAIPLSSLVSSKVLDLNVPIPTYSEDTGQQCGCLIKKADQLVGQSLQPTRCRPTPSQDDLRLHQVVRMAETRE
ncbi:hypothetical protein HF086_017203 [Spodoptera exigua]|uniref:Uncharacterized protein n=1 Tax=Spodoptera exigua TaxID=7107 RepID=A0A922ME20_SPOEX|nr:hypothetical protein HF086_017203 [Spodoptera exigua]